MWAVKIGGARAGGGEKSRAREARMGASWFIFTTAG
jgi:hypothetical protein